MKNMTAFVRLWTYLKRYKGQFIGAIFATIVMTVASVLEPFIIGLAFTELAANVVAIARQEPGAAINYHYILIIAVVYFFRGMLYHVSQYVSQWLLTNVVQKAMYDLRNDISKKTNRIPVSYFDSHQAGDLLSRMTNDVNTITNALQQSLMQFFIGGLSILFAVIAMLLLDWKLALVVTAIVPISYYIARYIIKYSQPTFKNQADSLGDLFGYTQEQLSGFTEIKVYNKQEESVEGFKKRNERLCEYGFKANFISSLIMPCLGAVTHLAYIAISILGGISVINGTLTVGNLQAFVQYIWQINQPITVISQLSGMIQSAAAAVTRVFDFLDEENDHQDKVTGHLPNKVKGHVSFEHVRFGYKKDQPLMKDVSFNVKPGETVAVVGPTGAGKTTLINLLMRFYDVDGGSIKIDGVDTKTISRLDLRRHFGMVLQDAWLYSTTIMENIRFGDLDATDYEVIEAAQIANVDRFIRTLPGGYSMEINEEANNISLGQKQLMTIARAIISNPDILILDEATSSVDTRLEKLIQEAMDKVMQGRTSFVIAHRLSTIKNADLILVMQDGNIIEHGTHDSLLAANGFYADLYQSQFEEETPAEIHMSY